MALIHIDTPTTDGRTLRTTVRPSSDLARFFTGNPLEVTYDVDLESVPDSLLVVPALAQVCPVAWAAGADVYVDTVDATFVSALEDVQAAMLEMYDFLEGSDLYAREVVDTRVSSDDSDDENAESGLLFTGGVDSTCSYVRHREEEPTLISIRGWTITPNRSADEQWGHLVDRVTGFAADRGLETAFVEANMLSFLDHPMLLAHYKRYVDGGWYSSVGHGLGLLGLCAPLAAARDIEDLYMAATHWEGIDLEWGSRPDIDDNVRWAKTQCHHDAYDLTRQERLDVLAAYAESDAPDLELQTCNDRMDGNCGVCEKCYRTAVGLRLAGLEPTEHGYPFADDDYHDLRRGLEGGRWILGQDERYMWEDIRDRVHETEPRSPPERAFFAWLESADLSEIIDNSGSPLRHRVLRAGARNAPDPVYTTLYPAWSIAKASYQRLLTRR
ncbi:hypothetical protein [Natronosalvus rutilus]|uniref:Uncharacterized protein n=1 Tax=Natronosalvus rutilus TaxID=2953753 RepID=A0A9E7NEE1_9EURY|nr:hypothetical protein [Natronosalvus rutilus]UTF55459.1 hypothetical protein NGM29_08120 [Natronosalvus rutilus]